MTTGRTDAGERLAASFGPFRGVEPLAADASVRIFLRVHRDDGSTAVGMVDPSAGVGGIERMVAAAERLRALGAPVPAILGRDDDACALLLEDLGDDLLADLFAELAPARLEQAYLDAGRIAGRITAAPAPAPGDPLSHPRLGLERLRGELSFFVVHDVVRRRGREGREMLSVLGDALDALAHRCSAQEMRLAHRDFHARNLMVSDDGSLGLVDFQDALGAPLHYDLVSLLWDPYVELTHNLVEAALAGYAEGLGQPAPALDDPALVHLALQRMLKAIGTYARQALDLGRARFEESIPPTERRVRELLERLPVSEAEALRQPLLEAGLAVD